MIKVVAIGKVKDKHLAALIEDYTKRIGRYHKIEVIEVKDEAIADNEKAVMDKEGERALARIDKDDYVILLDLHGKSIDSLSLANKIDSLFTNHPKICFVIGGSLGLSEKLLEQIYRSFKILNHETYHK